MSNIRSILLVVRGSYQAGMALRMARTDIENLTKVQKQTIRASEEMVRVSHQILFAGAAFTVFGALVTRGLMKVMEASQEGRKALFNFSRSTTQSLRRISRALAPMMESFLKATAGIMEFISKSPLLSQVAAGVLMVAGPLLLLSGIIVTIGGAGRMLIGVWLRKKAIADVLSVSVQKLTASITPYGLSAGAAVAPTQALSLSMGALVGILMRGMFYFTMVYTVANMINKAFGPLAGTIVGLTAVLAPFVALLWGGAAAMSVMTMGAAALAGAAMIGTVVQSIPSYQAGTAFVRQGGLAMLHGGEEIKSARESRFISKIEKTTIQAAPSGPQTVGYYNIPITIDQLNTRADVEDLGMKIKRALKDALDNKV